MKFKKTFAAAMAAVSALLVVSSVNTASAETWRMATKMPTDSPEGKVFSYFADQVKKETDGKLTITVFPNEQLGKEDAVLEQLQSGIINIYAEGFPFMRKWVPELQWIEPPFIFDGFDHWARFMHSDLVTGWFKEAAEKSGIIPLGSPTEILRGPYRVMVSNKPVNSIEDLKGLKLRMHNAKLNAEVWSTLGAEVITLPWSDVYSAISKGIVNAVNSPMALVESMRFNEVAPYIIRNDEYWQSVGFMMNQKSYEALDETTKEQVLKAYKATGEYSKKLMNDAADASLERMKAKGASFSVIDTAKLVQMAAPYYQGLADAGKLPEGLLETVNATRK
nr:TRAP transporter substrate-binding protein [uncultured Cohaesibacter sp.]